MSEYRPGGLELTEKTARAMGLKAGESLLDIGCGLGKSLSYLEERYNIEPYGVDISPETVRRAGKAYVTVADACRLPFEDRRFDAALMECSLSLIKSPEDALREAARVLKTGGRLAVSGLSADDRGALSEDGRIDFARLEAELVKMGFKRLLLSDESACLRQFVAKAIFAFGSLEEYAAHADAELGGSVLDGRGQARGTGYKLLVAVKEPK